MKKLFISSAFLFCTALLPAQVMPHAAVIDINNVHMPFQASGDHLMSSTDFTTAPGGTITGWANLWIGGLDGNSNLHVAAQTYRQTGDDFWPGPLDTITVVCPPVRSTYYDKVWKINKTTIDSFRQGLFTVIPAVIATWPGNGDPAYDESPRIAPYIDVNADGIYDPASGDYPDIRGDQALFFVYNDHLQGQSHTESGGLPIGLEIRCMVYAVNCGDPALQNTVFVHYQIINRSTIGFTNARIGLWSDVDGNADAFYPGSDSLLGASYNTGAGRALGVIGLNQQLTGSRNYQNDFSVYGNPQQTQDYYSYLSYLWQNGAPVNYGGMGYNGTTNTSWMFTGNPISGNGWNDTAVTVDMRSLATIEPYMMYTMQPGETITWDLAWVYATDPTDCVSLMKQRMQSVKSYYTADQTPCGNNITSVAENHSTASLLLFPNPASSQIMLQTTTATPQPYSIYNCAGELLLSGTTSGNETTIDIRSLPAGIYILRTPDGAAQRFVKTE